MADLEINRRLSNPLYLGFPVVGRELPMRIAAQTLPARGLKGFVQPGVFVAVVPKSQLQESYGSRPLAHGKDFPADLKFKASIEEKLPFGPSQFVLEVRWPDDTPRGAHAIVDVLIQIAGGKADGRRIGGFPFILKNDPEHPI